MATTTVSVISDGNQKDYVIPPFNGTPTVTVNGVPVATTVMPGFEIEFSNVPPLGSAIVFTYSPVSDISGGSGAGAVSSVNSQVGAVVLDKAAIGLPLADNTPDAQKPVSTAQAAAIAQAKAEAIAAIPPGGGGGSTITPTTESGNQITFATDGTPLIGLSDGSGNTVTYNGIKLMVQLEAVAGLIGIDVWEKVIGNEAFATPVYDKGDRLLVGRVIFKKVQDPNSATGDFIYILDRPYVYKPRTNLGVGKSNASTAQFLIGTFEPSGDSMYWSETTVATITLGADQPIKNLLISLGFSGTRDQTKYWVEKLIPADNTTNTVTFQVKMSPRFMTKLNLDQVSAATAPTKYPQASKVVDCNLLGAMKLPVRIKFNDSAAPLCTITSCTMELKVSPPTKKRFDKTKTYKKASQHPFVHTDPLNSSINTGVVARNAVYTHNWGSTGNSTSGTVNASGAAGQDIVTVYSTAGVNVGDYPAIVSNYGSATTAGISSSINTKLTRTTFGAGSKIIEIISATQFRVSKNLLLALSCRGKESWGEIKGIAAYPTADTLMIREGWVTTDDTQYNPFTGIYNSGSPSATDRIAAIPIFYQKDTDVIKQWHGAALVSFNGWPMTTPQASNLTGGENFQDFFYFMRTPAEITALDIESRDKDNYANNPDNNWMMITSCGKYSLESIGFSYNSTTGVYNGGRMCALALNDKSCSDILDRPELITTGISDATRAPGAFGLIGGVCRASEFAGLPDSSKTTETLAEITANVAIAMNAIQHAIGMTIDVTQAKSRSYVDEFSSQTPKKLYLNYKSQYNIHRPVVEVAGTGYVPGESLRIVGGDFVSPMLCTVQTVDAVGGVTSVFVSKTGQYRSAPPSTSLATTASYAGTGCVLSVLGTGDAAVVDIATAFPVSTIASTQAYPGTCVDSAWATIYSGVLEMGAFFTIDQTWDLAAAWIARRTANPASATATYEQLAVLAAIQKFGAFNADVAYFTHWICHIEGSLVLTPTFNRLNVAAVRREIKGLLIYVENYSPLGKGGGTAKWPVKELLPIHNPIATLS